MHYEDFEKEFLKILIEDSNLSVLTSMTGKQAHIQHYQELAQKAWQTFSRVLIKNNSKVVKND